MVEGISTHSLSCRLAYRSLGIRQRQVKPCYYLLCRLWMQSFVQTNSLSVEIAFLDKKHNATACMGGKYF